MNESVGQGIALVFEEVVVREAPVLVEIRGLSGLVRY